MHWHQLHSQISQVFQVISHTVGLFIQIHVPAYSFCGWADRNTSSWFCFDLWSARRSKYICFQRKFFDPYLKSFLLVVIVLLVAQVRDQFIQALRNSDPRVRSVSVYRLYSDLNSVLTVQATSCNFQCGSNLGVPSDLTFWFRCIFVSWQGVLTTDRCTEWWEFFSVFCHEVLSNPNCCQESCICTNLNHTFFCCDGLSTRSWYFCNRSSFEGFFSQRCKSFHQQSCWLEQ